MTPAIAWPIPYQQRHNPRRTSLPQTSVFFPLRRRYEVRRDKDVETTELFECSTIERLESQISNEVVARTKLLGITGTRLWGVLTNVCVSVLSFSLYQEVLGFVLGFCFVFGIKTKFKKVK